MTVKDNRLKLKRALRRAAKETVEDTLDRIQELARRYVPVKTGNLHNSILTLPVDVKGLKATGTVGVYGDGAAPVEYGSAARGEPFGSQYTGEGAGDWDVVPPGKKAWGPYKIRPKNPNGYLRFVDSEGNERFAKEVTHPGIEAQPYFRPAIDRVRFSEFKKIALEAYRRAFAREKP